MDQQTCLAAIAALSVRLAGLPAASAEAQAARTARARLAAEYLRRFALPELEQ